MRSGRNVIAFLPAGLFAAMLLYAGPTRIGLQSLLAVGSPGSVVLIGTDGAFRVATLGPGLAYDAVTNRLIVNVMPSPRHYNVLMARQGDGTWKLPELPNPGSLQLWRNGILMIPGTDYAIAGEAVTFTPAQGFDPLDTISAAYDR